MDFHHHHPPMYIYFSGYWTHEPLGTSHSKAVICLFQVPAFFTTVIVPHIHSLPRLLRGLNTKCSSIYKTQDLVRSELFMFYHTLCVSQHINFYAGYNQLHYFFKQLLFKKKPIIFGGASQERHNICSCCSFEINPTSSRAEVSTWAPQNSWKEELSWEATALPHD